MVLQVRVLDPIIDGEQVRELISSSSDSWIDHHPEAWPLLGEKVRAYAITDSDSVIAMDVFGLSRMGLARTLQTPGFITLRSMTESLRDAIQNLYVRAVKDFGASLITVRRPVERFRGFGDYRDRELESLGLTPGGFWGNMGLPGLALAHVLDLSAPREELMAAMSENHRRSLKRSNAIDVTFRWLTGDQAAAGLSAARRMHEVTFDRTKTTHYGDKLWKTLQSLASLNLCSVASLYEGRDLHAAAVILHRDGSARYLIGGSTEFGLRQGLYVRLHVETAMALAASACFRYNMGFSFPSMPTGKMKNIGEFKRRFGGTAVPYDVYTLMGSRSRFALLGLIGSDAQLVAGRAWRRTQNRSTAQGFLQGRR